MSNNDDDLDAILDSALDDLAIQENQKTERSRQSALLASANATPSLPVPVPSVPVLSSTSSSAAPAPPPAAAAGGIDSKEEFSAGLAKIMEELSKGDFEKQLQELTKQLERSDNSGSSTAATNSGSNSSNSSSNTTQSEVQKNVEKTLQNLSESAKKLNAVNGSAPDEAAMKQIMDQFDQNPEFQNIMENMMNQLMSKDILYPPMKEMKEKYPVWLQANGSKLSAPDFERYTKQYQYVTRICTIYETEPANTAVIVQLMHEMQEFGQPPPEIVKELAPDSDLNSSDADRNVFAALAGAAGGSADGKPPCAIM